MKPDLAGARAAATALLLEQRLYSLRIDVTRLRYKQEILFDSMQHFCSLTRTTIGQLSAGTDCLRDGCTLAYRREGAVRYLVLYNEAATNRGRRGFTLAHEVGHILLGHQEDGDVEEQEANAFAAQLLAPEVLLHALADRYGGSLLPEEVCHLFALSRQAAENRLSELTRNPHPTFGPEDKALLSKASHFLPMPDEPLVDA